MKAEQDPRFDMHVNRDDLQKDFEEAAKNRIEELKNQSKADKDGLKSEVDDLKNEADKSYENVKAEMKDWDDPYADEKAEVEEASNKVVKKEIDADYQDSIDNIEYETDHRVDSINRLMNEDMNKDYDKGVDAIYLNQSEDKFQHEKDHYANRKEDKYSDKGIKASYDDIAEENAADRVSHKGCGCGTTAKSDNYKTNEKWDKDMLKAGDDKIASSDKVKDYQSIYGGNSCKADVTKDNLKNTSSDNIKAASSNTKDHSDHIKDYTTEKPQGCGCSSKETNSVKNTEVNTRLKNSGIQENYQDSISDNNDDLPGYTITEEYVMIISDDASDDDVQQDSSDEYKSQMGQNSSFQQKDNSSNINQGMKCGSGISSNNNNNNQHTYSKANNVQDNTSRNNNAKANSCNYDLKQDILDETDRVMGDDMI